MKTQWSDARWLAGRQIKDVWSSYLFSGAYFAFMGAVLARDTSWALEFGHVVLMLILIQSVFASRYFTWSNDNESARQQIFLRSFPLPFLTIVGARFLSMAAAGLINVPLYFGWWWFVDNRWDSPIAFLAWVVFWIGFGFAGLALNLVQEFWLTFKKWTLLNASILALIASILLLSVYWSGFEPVDASMRLSNNHPFAAIAFGVAMAIASSIAGLKLGVVCFRRREFAP